MIRARNSKGFTQFARRQFAYPFDPVSMCHIDQSTRQADSLGLFIRLTAATLLYKVHVTPHTKKIYSTTGHIIGYRQTRTRVQSSFSLFKRPDHGQRKPSRAQWIQFQVHLPFNLMDTQPWLFLLFSPNFHREDIPLTSTYSVSKVSFVTWLILKHIIFLLSLFLCYTQPSAKVSESGRSRHMKRQKERERETERERENRCKK